MFLRNHQLSDTGKTVIKKMFALTEPYFCVGKPSTKIVHLINPMTGLIINSQSEETCKLWQYEE